MKLLIICWQFLAFSSSVAEASKHFYLDVDQFPHPVNLRQNAKVKRDTSKIMGLLGPMRIKVFFHDSLDQLPKKDRDAIKLQVVPTAVRAWSQALNVIREERPVKLNRKCRNNQYFLLEEDPGEQYCKNECEMTKCGEFVIPLDHLMACKTCDDEGRRCRENAPGGMGVPNADFVLYVSALATPQCQASIGGEAETVAYAAHCQQEAHLDRPIAGHTNICPSALNSTNIESLTSTIRHELLHALGFSASLFAFFRDENGRPRTPRDESGKPPINLQLRVRAWSDQTISTVVRPWKVRGGFVNRSFSVMTTPKVLQEVRAHFACPTLEGAELEDQGGDGTALTHWEKRVFQDEAMTGTVHTQDPAYSRITFALLEDTGWYKPNYRLAHEITWGKGMGCDFAQKSCMELMESNDSRYPFCSALMSSQPTTCTFDASAVGSCNLVQFDQELPEEYQNFNSVEGLEDASKIGFVGGSVTLADFCPYIQEFLWKSADGRETRGTKCGEAANQPKSDNYALEEYGPGSMCVEQARSWEQRSCSMVKQWHRFGAGCYSSLCEDGVLKIQVQNATLTCTRPGQVIEVARTADQWLHEGSLVCPPCSAFCDDCSNENKEHQDDNDSLKESLNCRPNSILGFLESFMLHK